MRGAAAAVLVVLVVVREKLIQRFTYTCTCVSHVIERSAAIYKGGGKV